MSENPKNNYIGTLVKLVQADAELIGIEERLESINRELKKIEVKMGLSPKYPPVPRIPSVKGYAGDIYEQDLTRRAAFEGELLPYEFL